MESTDQNSPGTEGSPPQDYTPTPTLIPPAAAEAATENAKNKKEQKSAKISSHLDKLRAREEKKKEKEVKKKQKEEQKKQKREEKNNAEKRGQNGERKQLPDPETLESEWDDEPEEEETLSQKICRRVCLSIVILISVTFIGLAIYIGIQAVHRPDSADPSLPGGDGNRPVIAGPFTTEPMQGEARQGVPANKSFADADSSEVSDWGMSTADPLPGQ